MPTLDTIVAETVDILALKGDTMEASFTLTDDNEAAIDLSGATLLMEVRKTAKSDDVELTLTESDGITVSGAESNIINLSKIVDIDAGCYVYDIQATYGSGVVTTYLRGAFTVEEDVTE
jgi:hypothetical protein